MVEYQQAAEGGTLYMSTGISDSAQSLDDADVIAVAAAETDEPDQVLLYVQPCDNFAFHEISTSNLPMEYLRKHAVSSYLQQWVKDSSKAIDVVVSTKSGTLQAQLFYDNVVQKSIHRTLGNESVASTIQTTSDRSVTELATSILKKANGGKRQLVLLLSGDGGIVDILDVLSKGKRSLQYVRPVVGLLALGTGNALANSTGLNKDHTKGLKSFFHGRPEVLPSFRVVFSPGSTLVVNEGRDKEVPQVDHDGNGLLFGAVVCSWGIHASLVADSDTTEYRKHGSDRFTMVAKELLAPSDGSPPHVYKGKITLTKKDGDGRVHHDIMKRRDHEYILATLVSNLEENLTISPRSRPFDGQLRLLHFGPMPSDQVMGIMGLAYQGGKHVDNDLVGYEEIEGMRIDFEEDSPEWRRVCVDGKIVQVSEAGWIELEIVKNEESVMELIADLPD